MKIRILDEIKNVVQEGKPPKNILFKYIPGKNSNSEVMEFIHNRFNDINFDDVILPVVDKEERTNVKFVSDLDFYISSYAFDKLFNHCFMLAKNGLEAMGFMIGELKKKDDKVFSIVNDIVTSDLESTPVSVRFSRDAFEKIFDQLDDIGYDYILLGWYHSHPGFSSFMSVVDVDTQRRIFNKMFHAALVLDPVNSELKSFRMSNDICIEIPYAIFFKKNND